MEGSNDQINLSTHSNWFECKEKKVKSRSEKKNEEDFVHQFDWLVTISTKLDFF